MKILDGVKSRGEIEIRKYTCGQLVDVVIVNNLVTDRGRQHFANQASQVALETPISYVGVGSGSGRNETDQTLSAETGRSIIQSKNQGVGDELHKIIYVFEVDAGVGTGNVTEAGLFNASTGGVMACYQSFEAIEKGANDSLVITWKVGFN